VNDLPEFISKFIFPKAIAYDGFLLLCSLHSPQLLDRMLDGELVSLSRKRNAIKWKKFIEKHEKWPLGRDNYKLLLVCSLLLSACVSENEFKRRMRLN
jgi:hypothetical protein